MLWAVRCVVVSFALILASIGIYAAIYQPPPNIYPPVVGIFQTIVDLDKPNPIGDQQLWAQTNNWNHNPNEYFIGVQTYRLYHGWKDVALGITHGRVTRIAKK